MSTERTGVMLKPRPLPYGAHYCYQCVAEHLAGQGTKPAPEASITLWPCTMPIIGPAGIMGYGLVALPACASHLAGSDGPAAVDRTNPAEVEDSAINQNGLLRPAGTGIAAATGSEDELKKFRGGLR